MKTPIVIYDTKINPASFDIVAFLAAHYLKLQLEGHQGSFDLALICDRGRDAPVERDYSPEYFRRKARSVLFDSAAQCRWVRNIYFAQSPDFDPRLLTESYLPLIWRPGLSLETLPDLHWKISPMVPLQIEAFIAAGASFKELGFRGDKSLYAGLFSQDEQKKSVAFHFRDSPQNPGRNTPKDVFLAAARQLKAQGVRVLLIPDFDNISGLDRFGDEFEIIHSAASQVGFRLALAESVDHNVVWSGGNNVMFWYAEIRFSLFGILNEDLAIASKDFFRRKGPIFGRNPVWFSPFQYLDWTPAQQVNDNIILTAVNRAFSET